jgi:Cu-Zn family superoxide dismutase
MKRRVFLGTLSVLVLAAGMAVGQGAAPDQAAHENMWKNVTKAVAVLHSPDPANATVMGVIRFEQVGDKVHVTGEIKGLAPNSEHGFHVHEFGDISPSADNKYDGLNAGGHYNPEGATHQHAGMDAANRHAGDFGNVKADAKGVAHIDFTVDNISVAGLKDPIIGRGLVVHANPDDLKSQPAGNAGGRIAVAVIGIAK